MDAFFHAWMGSSLTHGRLGFALFGGARLDERGERHGELVLHVPLVGAEPLDSLQVVIDGHHQHAAHLHARGRALQPAAVMPQKPVTLTLAGQSAFLTGSR